MGLFSRVRDGLTTSGEVRPSSRTLLLRGGQEVRIVGEASYQEALNALCGGKRENGSNRPCEATLVREPTNPYDSNAIAIYIEGRHVGYLDRVMAPTYGPLMTRLAEEGACARCNAHINGGWDRGGGDTGNFGVILDLADPRFAHPNDPPPPVPAASKPTPAGIHTGTSRGTSNSGLVRKRHYTEWVDTVKDSND